MPIIAVDKPQKSSGMPFPLGAAIGAGVSFLGGLFSNKSQSKNVDKQIAAQRQENALNREYNAREAERNRLFQRSQIMDYRAYNSPANQAKLMQQAGYHPMAALGQFGSMDAGLSSGAQASSSGGISPVGYSPDNFAAAGSQISQLGLLDAQKDVLESQAEKNRADAHNSESSALTTDALREGLATLNNIEVEFARGFKEAELNILKGQFEELNETISNLKVENSRLSEEVSLLKEEVIAKRLDNRFHSDTYNDAVKKFAAEADISFTEAKFASASFAIRLMNLQADYRMKLSDAAQKSAVAEFLNSKREIMEKQWDEFHVIDYNLKMDEHLRMRFDLKMDQEFEPLERSLGLIRGGIETSMPLLDFLFPESYEELYHHHNYGNDSWYESRNRNRSRIRRVAREKSVKYSPDGKTVRINRGRR